MPPDRESLVGDALNQAQDIARSVHDLSHRLHPTRLRLIGLVAALKTLQRELSRSGTDDHVHPRERAGNICRPI